MPILQKHTPRFDAIAVRLGRVGFIARGFVWASLGGVTVSAVFTGDEVQGRQGALDVVAQSTGGTAVLVLATIGIFCYVGWRIFEGLYRLRVKPSDKKWKKIIDGYLVPFASSIFYLIFAGTNIYTIIRGRKGDTGGGVSASFSKNIVGQIVLQLAAVILWGVVAGWVAILLRGTFKTNLVDKEKLNRHKYLRFLTFATGYLGIIGRCILFLLLGILLTRVAWTHLDNGDGGFGAALQQLQNNTFGKVVLFTTGILLVVFGVYSILMSQFKEFLPYETHTREIFRRNSVDQHISDFWRKRDEKKAAEVTSPSETSTASPTESSTISIIPSSPEEGDQDIVVPTQSTDSSRPLSA